MPNRYWVLLSLDAVGVVKRDGGGGHSERVMLLKTGAVR